jgi:hypothetical protein
MEDDFLKNARRDPRPEFAQQLREKLERLEAAEAAGARPDATRAAQPDEWTPAPVRRLRWNVAWAGLGSVAVAAVAMLFIFPSVRASAQAFLDLFRVRTFAAVSVDPARLEKLKSSSIDLKGLLSDRVETVRDPERPRFMASPEEAGRAAGFAVRTPSFLPTGMAQDSVFFHDEAEVRLTVDASRLSAVMQALEINDLRLPAGLDGQVVTVHTLPAVGITYRSERRDALLLQSRSPEITLPPGVNLPQLGEIGLRIVGLDAAEAHRFAQSIDWNTTLLIPVPAAASSFNQVTVRGNPGLLITTREPEAAPPAAAGASGDTTRTAPAGPGEHHHRHRAGSVLLWSEGEMVYAVMGNLDQVDLVQLAESLH